MRTSIFGGWLSVTYVRTRVFLPTQSRQQYVCAYVALNWSGLRGTFYPTYCGRSINTNMFAYSFCENCWINHNGYTNCVFIVSITNISIIIILLIVIVLALSYLRICRPLPHCQPNWWQCFETIEKSIFRFLWFLFLQI